MLCACHGASAEPCRQDCTKEESIWGTLGETKLEALVYCRLCGNVNKHFGVRKRGTLRDVSPQIHLMREPYLVPSECCRLPSNSRSTNVESADTQQGTPRTSISLQPQPEAHTHTFLQHCYPPNTKFSTNVIQPRQLGKKDVGRGCVECPWLSRGNPYYRC